MNVCPRCQAKLETPLACSACGALVAEATGAAQNPFALFGLELGFALDKQALRRRLLRFSRLMHPDFFATAGAEPLALAESASAALNAAHELLADDAARADWLVRELGGPDEKSERAMPQEFLMEVLDWNETLESARSAPAGSAERTAIRQLCAQLEERRRELFETIARELDPLPAIGSPKLALLRKQLNAARYLDKTIAEIGALRVSQTLSQ